MEKILKPLVAIFVFVVIQAGATYAVMCGKMMAYGISLAEAAQFSSGELSGILIASSLLTIGAIVLMRMVGRHAFSVKDINWHVALVGMIGGFGGLFAFDLISEYLNLEDTTSETFFRLANTLPGFICMAILGPITEEVVFREGIIGHMTKHGVNPWIAILVSAFSFGVVHLNPIQIPFAIVGGIIFGVLYVKSGNIVITTILHIINNSIAALQMVLIGESYKDFTFKEAIGFWNILLIIILVYICVLMMRYFYQNYKSPKS